MTTRRVATCCGVGLPSGYAVANMERGPRLAGMRPSASVDRRRCRGIQVFRHSVEEAEL